MISRIPSFDLTPYFSSDWFSDLDKSSIHISVYSLPTIKAKELPRSTIIYDFVTIQARGVISHCSYTYYDISELSPPFRSLNSLRMESDSIPIRTVKPAVYLAIASPFMIDGVEKKLPDVENTISHAVSMLMCVIGRSVAYKHIFNTIYNLNNKGLTLISPSIDNHWVFGQPSLGRLNMRYLSLLENQLRKMPQEFKDKISLSLRWFKMASHDKGIDAFLKFWIAIETVALPKTNIKPLRTILANAYCIPEDDVDKHFGVGRIYGFRCDNVHDGFFNRIDSHFLRYMSCLFSDVLFQILGLPAIHKAAACLNDPTTGGLDGLLKQITIPKTQNKKPQAMSKNVIYT